MHAAFLLQVLLKVAPPALFALNQEKGASIRHEAGSSQLVQLVTCSTEQLVTMLLEQITEHASQRPQSRAT